MKFMLTTLITFFLAQSSFSDSTFKLSNVPEGIVSVRKTTDYGDWLDFRQDGEKYGLTFQISNLVREIGLRAFPNNFKGDDAIKKLYGNEKLREEDFGIINSFESDKILLHDVNGLSSSENGLISTISAAYNTHTHLVLRPDDLWHAITSAYSLYVRTHSQQLRKVFVNFDGKKELEIKIDTHETIRSKNEEFWEYFHNLMAQEVQKNIKLEGFQAWLTNDFSTTTTRDKIVSQFALLNSVSSYFSYKGIMMCGIPKMTLKGTLEDWQKLRQKASRLPSFGNRFGILSQWTNALLPVLDQFIQAYQGHVDLNFWERIMTSERLGSGHDKRLTGWILVFSPFNEKGSYILNSYIRRRLTDKYGDVAHIKIPSTINKVPVKIIDHGVEYKTIFAGGLSRPEFDPTTGALSPGLGWAIAKEK